MKAYILKLNKDANLLEQWDFGLIKDFLNGKLWKTANWTGFEIIEVKELPKDDKAIVLIAGRHHLGYEDEINKQLQKINKVVFFCMGDEEGLFNLSKIEHNNVSIWVQNADPNKHDNYFRIGTGYPARAEWQKEYIKKDIDIFFSGQITHNRRQAMQYALETDLANYNKEINYTAGFTQGFEPALYYDFISRSLLMPCPSGAVVPDSFRLFEALEGMSIPIADEVDPEAKINNYWDWLFNEITPFPKINDWNSLRAIADESLVNATELRHKITAWWLLYKRNLAYKIMEQIK